MLGLGLGLTAGGGARMSPGRYLQGGVAPSLVLDPGRRIFASDLGAWSIRYEAGGLRPALALDFSVATYGSA
ncbi:hypothetical protein [Phaeovulum sp. W22_SRMD_FR3]|uniref:hypothetical protein n=1 Tax=Phaeovulum sp. W22_SRMD_FR3 TaxID=3240274 RepID=UPI003F9E85F3